MLLLDEPCAALDPVATYKIEQLLLELCGRYTIVIVTHNLQQASRIADKTAFFYVDRGEGNLVGQLIEYAPTQQLFGNPAYPRTADYISGRFG
ncbi:MAG: hypothetical protein OHK0022_04490 [Roseiflexaceae bacterium]